MTNDEWNSRRIIGNVRKAYDDYRKRKWYSRNKDNSQDPEWEAFYNGWLEGRIDMLGQIKGIIDDKK